MFQKGSVFSDLHIHSIYCGNLSKRGDVEKLVQVSKLKGLGLVGTGDLTNRKWREIVYSETVEDKGLQYFSGFPLVLSVEVSCSDKAHHLLLLPDRASADSLISELSKFGKTEKMGRPFLSLNSRELLELVLGIDERIELIPAHVWTPHYGIFGEEAHYNSLEAAFGDLSGKVRSIETGLSSDPEMNRRMDWLDNKAILSFSDCHAHTLARIGREATAIKPVNAYSELISQIRKNEILGTVEVFPEFGKYHYSGHRKCQVSFSPKEARKLANTCPKCGKPLTAGVEDRVSELERRGEGKFEKPSISTLPLPEIISSVYSCGTGTKRVLELQGKFISGFGSELTALLFADFEGLSKVDSRVASAIVACREGKVALTPGFDGQYGEIRFL